MSQISTKFYTKIVYKLYNFMHFFNIKIHNLNCLKIPHFLYVYIYFYSFSGRTQTQLSFFIDSKITLLQQLEQKS